MKLKGIYILFFLISVYIITSAYKTGAAGGGYNCTGAETGLSNPTGCRTCHGSSAITTIGLTLELDSAGTITTRYSGGKTYTVKLKGVNNSAFTLPKFGFQICSILGTTSQTTPTQTGTWNTPYTAGSKYTAPQAGNFTVGVLEQTGAQNATSGTGTTGTTYEKSFSWTAPASGTGDISIWAVLNAVNGNNTDDTGDKWNRVQLTLNEWPAISTVGLKEDLSGNASINLFPNPSHGRSFLKYNLNTNSLVSIEVFNASGKKMLDVKTEAKVSGESLDTIDMEGYPQGLYFVKMSIDDTVKIHKLILE